MGDIYSTAGTIGGATIGGLFGIAQNILANRMQSEARKENYKYGEIAAENADKRTRALYADFYSPQALVKQYQEAGLSPSLMFGGTPGQGGVSGAQGAGATGLGTPFMPASLLEGAQIANLAAQTNKTKAETQNIQADTDLKLLDKTWNEMRNNEKSIDFQLTTTYLTNKETGEKYSLFELANNCNSYEQFIEETRKKMTSSGLDEMIKMTGTEAGQKAMRNIFYEANKFETEIETLSMEGVSAKFQKQIMSCLQQKDFAEQNAETAVKQLKAAGEAADLSAEQKGAWNRILDKLQRKNSTVADYIIVASMILNQAASHWGGMVTVVKPNK